jgi:hypothetical protein
LKILIEVNDERSMIVVMKIKDLIKKLKEFDEEKKIVVVDGNDYEYSLMDVNEIGNGLCEIWIENK